ncbi:MAG: hypothetical protein ACI8TQ_002615 [Planctomycetota bacterium]|jgi:hypothetical protein
MAHQYLTNWAFSQKASHHVFALSVFWPSFVISNVETSGELTEKHLYEWMVNLSTTRVRHQAGLRRVSRLVRSVHEHVVPGLIALGLALIRLIPIVGGFALQITRHDHSAISILAMPNKMSRLKTVRSRVGRCRTTLIELNHCGWIIAPLEHDRGFPKET